MSERPEACAEKIVSQIATSIAVSERMHEVGDEVHARVHEVIRLEKKGAHKTAEDLLRIRELKREIRELLQAGLPKGMVAKDPIILSTDATPIQPGEFFKLNDVETDKETFVRGTAEMFLTEWSDKLVHGPDSISFPILLAEANLLKPDERISELKRVTWRKPMRNNVTFAIYARAFEKKPTGADRYCMEGEFGTSEGRTLTFFGIENDQPVARRAERNPYARSIFCRCNDCHKKNGDSSHTFNLETTLPPDILDVMKSSSAITAATLLEIITYALVTAGIEQNAHGELTGHGGLLGRVSDLSIPSDIEDILRKGHVLEIRSKGRKIRTGQHGLSLQSFEYKFPHQEDFARGIVAAG